jgi:methionyl-tRNA synthetase
VLTFSAKRFGDAVPAGGEPGAAEERLGAEVARLLAELEEHMEALQYRKATNAVRALWSAGNAYLVEKEPWKQVKVDPEAAAVSLRTAMNLIHLYAVVSGPFIPETAATLRDVFALDGDAATWVTPEAATSLDAVPAGTAFSVPPVLFAKITDEDLEGYRDRFGGGDA